MVESKHILFTIGKYIIFFTHIQYKSDTYSIQMTKELELVAVLSFTEYRYYYQYLTAYVLPAW